jgi:hypothetical protein
MFKELVRVSTIILFFINMAAAFYFQFKGEMQYAIYNLLWAILMYNMSNLKID